MMERDDQLATLTPVEGDWVSFRSTSKGALWVSLADASGDPITSFGGGQEYTEDVAAPADPTGKAIVAIRDDQIATVTEVEGDWSTLRSTSKGALWVALADSSGDPITSFGGGTQYAVDTALGATPTGTLSIAIRDDALSALTPVEGDAIGLRVDANGALWTHDDALDAALAGSELQVDVVAALPAGTNNIGDVDVLSVVPGTGATNLGKAIDTATGATDTGVLPLATRDDALSALTPVEGDNIQLRVDANGALWVIPSGTVVVSATNLDIRDLTSTDVVTVTGGAGQTADVKITLDSETVPVTQSGTWDEVGINDSGNAITVDWAGTAPPIGAGLEATALRITVATDSTGVLSVDDNAGSLTVDGTVTAELAAGTNNIGDVDVLSVIPGTGATNLGKAIDTATGATDTGVLALATRDDALSALTPVEGDNIQLRVDANGALWTIISGTVAVTQSGTWDEVGINDSGNNISVDWAGTVPPIGAGTEAAALRVTVATDSTGVLSVDDNGGLLTVDGTVDVGSITTAVVPGTGATNLGKAEDAAHSSGDVGVFALGVRNDTPNAALSGTDLDYTPIALYRTGALRVAPPEEDFAVLGSNSVKKYYSNTGAVTDGIVWSPAAGKRWYVTDIFVGISAAATITLEDDLTAGDSTVWAMDAAANSGWSHSFSTPLFSGEDAADLIVTTTAGNVKIMVVGYEI